VTAMLLSRRALFGFGRPEDPGERRDDPQSSPVSFLRPPGALEEDAFLAACTRCDACLVACPRESIRRAGHELGEANEGTPVILPLEQPCWLCRDLPCVAACEPGALAPLAAPEAARLGGVRVRADACYSAQGSLCDVCAERCPVRPKAMRVAMGAEPELDADLCTGCAVCAWLCPARAIDVVPRGRQIRACSV
jgi:ferredoxin-type protein NapG